MALWLGAGFSLYAGYPDGHELGNKIKSELTLDEQAQLVSPANLRGIADALITFRNGSRNELNRILTKEFSRLPKSTHNHDLLSRVPHFKDIITSNYDGLIENSYAGRAHVVRSDADIPYIPHNTTTIYKVHGDLLAKDNIIVSGNDYARFIGQIKADNPLWTAIRHILAQKVIVIGYGFEDENLWSWLDTIDHAVGVNRRERFLIGPNWPDLKIKQLQARGITYLNSNGEAFLNTLHANLKENIVADLENAWVSQDTFNRYISLHEYDSKLINLSGKAKLSALYKKDKATTNKVNFIVKKGAARKLAEFQKGFGNRLIIDCSQLLSFEHYVDEFKMNMSASTIKSFHLVRLPQNHKARLDFPEDDLILDDLIFEMSLIKKNVFRILSSVYGFKVEITLTFRGEQSKIDFTLGSPEKFPAIHKCINLMRGVLSYLKGKRTLLHWNGSIKNITNKPTNADTRFWDTQLQFYKGIRLIENYFSLNFEGRDADHGTDQMSKVARLTTLIEQRFLPVGIKDGIKITADPTLGKLELIPPGVNDILVHLQVENSIELFGISIELGESVLQIEDLEPIDFSDGPLTATLKNKTGIAFQLYDAFPPLDTENNGKSGDNKRVPNDRQEGK